MAIPVLNILFAKESRTQIFDSEGVLDELTEDIGIDAVLSRSTEMSGSVTRATVEDGSSIADHVVLEPVSLTIDGIVSDHPVGLLEGLGSAVQAAGEILGLGQAETRSQKARKILEDARARKTLIEIVTRRRTYKNMVIERLSFVESAEVGDALRFTLDLIEIRKVASQTAPASNLAAATASLAQGAVDRGRQPAKPPPRSTGAVTSIAQAAAVL